jgi:hypothetical protein
MRKRRVVSIAFTGAAVVATGAMMNTPGAHAAATLKVTPGGKWTATAGATSLKDVTKNVTLKCKSATAAGSISKKTGIAPPAKFGFISKGTFGKSTNACSGPLGLKFDATISAATMNVTAFNATTGVTTGTLTGIKAKINGVGLSCSAPITGTQPFSYVNGTHQLHVLGSATKDSLTTGAVSGCLGAIASKDKNYFNGTYTVTPAQTVASS